jgi:hypothetical protein
MLTVGVEAGGSHDLCMVCAKDAASPHQEAFYVVLWGRDEQRPNAAGDVEGGMVRLCWEHLDELSYLIAEVL